MAETPGNPDDKAPEEQTQATLKRGLAHRVLRVLTSRAVLAALLAMSLVMQGVGFWYLRGSSTTAIPDGEVTLGQFSFEGSPSSTANITSAQFTLHLDLLDAVDQKARKRLEKRRFRVEQDVEELIRQAKGADFEPTSIAQLKRTLQERINASLEMRAIDEVIITDLHLDRRPVTEVAETDTSDDVSAPHPAG